MRNETLQTKNLLACFQAYGQLEQSIAEGTPAMGVLSGDSGLGKTTTACWLFVQADGVLVTCDRIETESSFLEKLCNEVGIAPKHSKTKTLALVKTEIAKINKPIFIDEADFIAGNPDILETIRGIYDFAKVPTILIGYEKLPTKVKALKQLRNRIVAHVKFQPADMEDIRLMASLVEGVTIKDDLLEALLLDAEGSFRDIRSGLSKIEKFAQANNLTEIDLSQWDVSEPFFFKGI